MATITIENAAVARIIEGYGFAAVEEKRIFSGETIKLYYTVWTKDQVSVGEVYTIEGDLQVKLDEYTGKDNQLKISAATHVNNAMLLKIGADESDAPF
jgi:hypothetical protein|tara:strand:- start:30 stop:323 length:294 start_codon:yes stop_codon:yes gene_type:complete